MELWHFAIKRSCKAHGELSDELVAAALGGDHGCVKYLIVSGADVNARNAQGANALDVAAEAGHQTIVELLLSVGAVPCVISAGFSFLHVAAGAGDEEMVRLLLNRAGEAVDQAAPGGFTALHMAAGRGHASIVGLLLEAGASTWACSSNGLTPLHMAAFSGYGDEVLDLLLAAGADVNIKSVEGIAPLHPAVGCGHGVVVAKLLAAGADVNVQMEGSNVFLPSVMGSGPGYGEDVHHLDIRTPLLLAAYHGYESIAHMLLAAGAHVDVPVGHGRTALHIAVNRMHIGIVRLLLEAGADVNVQPDEGFVALLEAACTGSDCIVEALLEHGASVNAQDGHGMTALHHAAFYGYEAVVQLLLDAGASIELTDGIGDTALHAAIVGGHEKVVDTLLRAWVSIPDSVLMDAAIESAHNRHMTHAGHLHVFVRLAIEIRGKMAVNIVLALFRRMGPISLVAIAACMHGIDPSLAEASARVRQAKLLRIEAMRGLGIQSAAATDRVGMGLWLAAQLERQHDALRAAACSGNAQLVDGLLAEWGQVLLSILPEVAVTAFMQGHKQVFVRIARQFAEEVCTVFHDLGPPCALAMLDTMIDERNQKPTQVLDSLLQMEKTVQSLLVEVAHLMHQ